MDEFTIIRLTRFVEGFKKDHGHDAAGADLERAGFDKTQVDYLVHRGVLDKYQVTAKAGRRENRFKLHRDWRTLKDP